jgi:acetyl-CoA carboxylase / biotin carboxylase 1
VQLCIAMGIPLHRIPDIRIFYGHDPFGDSPIDLENDIPVPPVGHVIASRVTGENAREGFKPTSGRIHQVFISFSQIEVSFF